MPKNLIFTEKEAEFLRELVKNKVEFMIVGLSAATLQGAPVVTQDIDLWFKNLSDPKLKKALKKVGGTYVPPFEMYPPQFAGENLALFDIVTHLHGLGDFEDEVKNTLLVPLGGFKLRVLSLERIIKSKKTLGRAKDKLTIPVLENALKFIQKNDKNSHEK